HLTSSSHSHRSAGSITMEYEVPTTMNDMQTLLRIVQGKFNSVLILIPLVSAFLIPVAYGQNVPAAPAAGIAGQAEAETPADIHVLVGRSLVVKSQENL